jgi:hypothetical protein
MTEYNDPGGPDGSPRSITLKGSLLMILDKRGPETSVGGL